jgi:hypothetical protein
MTDKKKLEVMVNHFNRFVSGHYVEIKYEEKPEGNDLVRKIITVFVNSLVVYRKQYFNIDTDRLYEVVVLELLNHGLVNCYTDAKRRLKDHLNPKSIINAFKEDDE